ncbi:oncomodulin-1 isoform X3 [Gorilla gorilla gorilla]|uniref:oncomodulin-1 isoform X3 n=1 Tax=Gorilla gorilla gorilla TaxID=9595 RepID=UPI0024463E51|nr:oncomodulin-1 isoform X2 [Gorilla gorilla gorilla]
MAMGRNEIITTNRSKKHENIPEGRRGVFRVCYRQKADFMRPRISFVDRCYIFSMLDNEPHPNLSEALNLPGPSFLLEAFVPLLPPLTSADPGEEHRGPHATCVNCK